jgi:hypothetical protein
MVGADRQGADGVEWIPAVASDLASGMLKANAFLCAPPTPQVYGDGVWLCVCAGLCVSVCVLVAARACAHLREKVSGGGEWLVTVHVLLRMCPPPHMTCVLREWLITV